MKKVNRGKKFVVRLRNQTDSRDDVWRTVWAKTEKEAKQKVTYDEHRFFLGNIYPIKEFIRYFGKGLV